MNKGLACFSVVILAAGFFYSYPVYADELSDLKNRVNELEERLDSELLFIKERQDADSHKIDEIFSNHIYATLEFEDLQMADSSFNAGELELLSELNLNDQINAYFEIEFEGEEAEVEQAWLAYEVYETVVARFGFILVPFGRYNLEHFNFRRDLTNDPVALRRIIPSSWSESGAGVMGNIFLGSGQKAWFENMVIDYQFFVINGLKDGFTATGSRDARGDIGSDNNNNKALVGRVGLAFDEGREIGISGYAGKYDDADSKNVTGGDLDWFFAEGPFELIGEYVNFRIENPSPPEPRELRGGFIQMNYHFWFDFLSNSFMGKRYESPTFTAVFRYGHARIKVAPVDNEEERWTTGLNYRPMEAFAFKLEYQWNRTENTPLIHGDSDGVVASVTASF